MVEFNSLVMWKLCGVCSVFVIILLIYQLVLLSLIVGVNKTSLMVLEGTNCRQPNAFNNDSSFSYHMHLRYGMCDSSIVTEHQDCILWTDNSFWKSFDVTIGIGHNRAEKQAKLLSNSWFVLQIGSLIGAVVGVLVSLLKIVVDYYKSSSETMDSRSSAVSVSSSKKPICLIVIIYVLLCTLSLYKMVLQLINYEIADGDALKYANEIVIASNWKTYYDCDAVQKSKGIGYYLSLSCCYLSLLIALVYIAVVYFIFRSSSAYASEVAVKSPIFSS